MDYEQLDIPSAKERFMQNEALYKKFLYRLPDSPVMTELEQHLADGNVEDAFKSVHTLKGMVGNLSLYRLMDAASKVTEHLRAGNMPPKEEMDVLRENYQAALDTIREIQSTDAALF